MIIGHGDIASAVKEIDRDDRIFFASGVSNSAEVRESEFRRERELLAEVIYENLRGHLIYFSSLSVFYADTPYTAHKRTMEFLVKKRAHVWTIARLGNIDFGVNPTTLINYLRARKAKGEPLDIQDTYRFIVDREEFLFWMNMIPGWNCELNIPGKRMKVAEIVERYVENPPCLASCQ